MLNHNVQQYKTMLTSQSFWMTCLFSGDSGLPGKTGDKPGDTPGDAPSNTSSLPTLTSLQVLMTLALRPLPSLATEKEAATRSNSRSAASARSLTMSSKLLRIQIIIIKKSLTRQKRVQNNHFMVIKISSQLILQGTKQAIHPKSTKLEQ